MKKRILIIVYVLLLCVTASFAWLSNAQESINEKIEVDFGVNNKENVASVTDFHFDAYLEEKIAENTYQKVEGKYSFDDKTMVPGARIPFRIRIKNLGTAEKKTKLVLDMHIDNFEPDSKINILDMMYIEIVLGEGFGGSDVRHIFKKLSEATVIGNAENGDFSLDLYGEGEELVIPTPRNVIDNGELKNDGESEQKENLVANGYVILNCHFYYDENATAEYQNMSIDGLSFRLE